MSAETGIISGSGFYNFFKGREVAVDTSYGQPSDRILLADLSGGKVAFLARHGRSRGYPPHRINYRANISALKKIGVKNVLGFYSVGSLRENIKPGEFLIPDDFIGFDIISFFDVQTTHITAEISREMRLALISALERIKAPYHSEGIYFETRGPRLETKAEINLLKNFAHVVGMTLQKEATLSMEAGMNYAALCSIDNFANGVAGKSPSQKEIEENSKRKANVFEKIIREIIQKKC